jgi:hypothetical protein
MPQVAELCVSHDAILCIDNDVQNTREGHHILDSAPRGRRDGPVRWIELGRRAEVEAARVTSAVVEVNEAYLKMAALGPQSRVGPGGGTSWASRRRACPRSACQ